MSTILVIDDDDVTIELLSDAFLLEGYQVLLAEDGRIGLELLATRHPDIVVCDLLMPGTEGRMIARIMQADPSYQATPLVIVSAVPREMLTLDISYAMFLEKPFTLVQLLHVITQLLIPGTATSALRLEDSVDAPT